MAIRHALVLDLPICGDILIKKIIVMVQYNSVNKTLSC